MKNMTFHVSHATQELLGKQKMSKMRSQIKFSTFDQNMTTTKGPLSCL